MSSLRVTRRLLALLAADVPGLAALSLFLTFAMSLSEGISLLLLMPLLDLVGVNQRNTMPNVEAWLRKAFDLAGAVPTLGSVLAIFVALTAVRAALAHAQNRVAAVVREDLVVSVRRRLYVAISSMTWSRFVTRRQSEFVHALTGEVGTVGTAANQLLGLVVQVVELGVYLGLAFHFSPAMSLLVLASGFVLAVGVRGRVAESRTLGKQAARMRERLHGSVAEFIGSMKTAKSFGAVQQHLDVFDRLGDEIRQVSLKVNAGENELQRTLELGSTVMLAIVVYLSVNIIDVHPGQLLIVIYVFARFMPRLIAAYRRVQALAGALPILEVVMKLQAACEEAAEPLHGNARPIALTRAVQFDRVSFTYEQRGERSALDEVTLEMPMGRTTAIVGLSGSGKSTAVDLLLGLLTPTSGCVRVDGQPLDGSVLTSWREQVSYVPQDTFLFHDTVRANLVWARPDATDADLWRALRMAAADRFVEDLPQGLDTIVGERGVLVSGGERQRLSLSRALLRRPRILVLDEATSALDSETEGRIQQAIEGLHRQMTIVIVTHRLSMVSGADLIHVIEGGRLKESGTWETLLDTPGGRFRDLCQAQGIHERPRAVLAETHGA